MSHNLQEVFQILRRLANDICHSPKIALSFQPFPGSGKQKGLWISDYSTYFEFSNDLLTMTGVLEFYKNVWHHWKSVGG